MTAANLHPFFAPQTLAKLQGLHLRASHIIEGFVAGLHRSRFHGRSIEFAEHREYSAGDDLRYLDWKLFARTDKYYVKQFEDETNLICYLVVDVSGSMAYRGPDSALTKFEYAQCLAAALAWLVLEQRDAVALTLFNDQLQEELHPSSSPAHLKYIVQTLEMTSPARKTRAGEIFQEVSDKLSKRGVVIVISDLFAEAAGVVAGLKRIRQHQHDVVVLHLMDPAELEFPFRRPILFRGLEQGSNVVTDPAGLRRTYLAELRKHIEQIQRSCRECDIDHRLVRTDQPFDSTLASFLTSRMIRRR